MRAPDIWQKRSAASKLAVGLLSPLGWVYGAVTDWKRARARRYRPRAKVVCVGNLTVGGSGKTPVVIAIAEMLKARGKRPIILSRGYGGSMGGPTLVDPSAHNASQIGDEPLLLARIAPVVVARDRRKGAALADANGADVIIMDDGHQNFTLEKDVSVVVVDAETGFGNEQILPAGPLRESIKGGLARAHAVVLLGTGSPALPDYSGPVVRGRLVPRDGALLLGKRVVAFAGIGRPGKFFDTLASVGADLVEEIAFGDHHAFSADEIARLESKAQSRNAMLVTTEKDYVRMSPAERVNVWAMPVEVQFEQAEPIRELLNILVPDA